VVKSVACLALHQAFDALSGGSDPPAPTRFDEPLAEVPNWLMPGTAKGGAATFQAPPPRGAGGQAAPAAWEPELELQGDEEMAHLHPDLAAFDEEEEPPNTGIQAVWASKVAPSATPPSFTGAYPTLGQPVPAPAAQPAAAKKTAASLPAPKAVAEVIKEDRRQRGEQGGHKGGKGAAKEAVAKPKPVAAPALWAGIARQAEPGSDITPSNPLEAPPQAGGGGLFPPPAAAEVPGGGKGGKGGKGEELTHEKYENQYWERGYRGRALSHRELRDLEAKEELGRQRKITSQQGKIVLQAEIAAEAYDEVMPDELLREHRMVREQLQKQKAGKALKEEGRFNNETFTTVGKKKKPQEDEFRSSSSNHHRGGRGGKGKGGGTLSAAPPRPKPRENGQRWD